MNSSLPLDLSSRICTDCGQEIILGGLRAVIAHLNACPRNAPNENIETHRRQVEQEITQKVIEKERQRINNLIQPQMNQQEIETFLTYSIPGFMFPTGIYFTNRYNDYRNKMIKKYLPK